MKTMNVGIVGYKFMGKAHSNAWKKAPQFFDMDVKPVLKVACGRHQDVSEGFCRAVGLGTDGDGLEEDGPPRRRGHRGHQRAPVPALRDRHGGRPGGQAHLLREAPGHGPEAGARDVRAGGEEGHHALHQPQLPPLPGGPPCTEADRRRQDRPDLPLARRLPAGLDHRPELPSDVASAEGVRGLRSAGRPELAQRGPGALPGRGHQAGHRDDGALHHGTAAARRGSLGHLQRESEGRGYGKSHR